MGTSGKRAGLSSPECMAEVAKFVKYLNRASSAVPVDELEPHQRDQVARFEDHVDESARLGDITDLMAGLLALTLDIFGAPRLIATQLADTARRGLLKSATLTQKQGTRQETVNR